MKYRYIIQAGNRPDYIANPINVRVLSDQYTDGSAEYRFAHVQKVDASIRFDNSNGDFDFLYSLETGGDKCKTITIVQQWDCGNEWTTHQVYQVRMVDCRFDLDNCIIDAPLNVWNEYTCLEDQWGDVIDVFKDLPGSVTVSLIRGELEFFEYQDNWYNIDDPAKFGGVPPASVGYRCYTASGIYSQGPPPSRTYTFKYAREIITLPVGEMPGEPWVLISTIAGNNKWAKQPILADYTELQLENFIARPPRGSIVRNVGGELFEYNLVGDLVSGTIDNGVLLSSVLVFFLNKFCSIPIRSNFLGINPIQSFDQAYPDFEPGLTQKCVLFQKSDVKRPSAEFNAKKFETTYKKILLGVCKLYNLLYSIRDGVMIIEHASAWERVEGIDLTDPKYSENIRNTRKYRYATEEVPRYEKFLNMEAGNDDFKGLPIEYVGDCVTDEEDRQTEEITTESLTTDIEYCMIHSDKESNKVSDEGMVLIACERDGDLYRAITRAGILEPTPHVNNVLSWAYLLQAYHTYKRKQRNGYINGDYQIFKSVVPIKVRDTISIPYCCDDVLELTSLLTTDMGNATIDTATYHHYTGMLDLTLRYEDEIGNNVCVRPNSFAFVSRDGDSWIFNTTFEQNGPLITELEITRPDGSVSIVTLSADDSGNATYIFPMDQDGTWKFRKRVRCSDIDASEWTDYVVTPQTNNPFANCDKQLPSTPVFVNRTGSLFKFSVLFPGQSNVYFPDKIQVEVTRPDGTVFLRITNPVAGGSNANPPGTIIMRTVETFLYPEAPGPVQAGQWRFRFRIACDAPQPGTYYPGPWWPNTVTVNV